MNQNLNMPLKEEEMRKNRLKVAREVKTEIKLWKYLKKYVMKRMVGKTLTKPLEKEINYTLSERTGFLKRLLNVNTLSGSLVL